MDGVYNLSLKFLLETPGGESDSLHVSRALGAGHTPDTLRERMAQSQE
jgi:hypothetical protein